MLTEAREMLVRSASQKAFSASTSARIELSDRSNSTSVVLLPARAHIYITQRIELSDRYKSTSVVILPARAQTQTDTTDTTPIAPIAHNTHIQARRC
eukprot:1415367-Rhodomonas_salina.1